MKIFYVYAHKRNDNDEVFYIGKGSKRRAWSKAGRNNLWKSVANQSGFYVEILKENLTEKQAFSLEEKLISKYGRLTKGNGCLTNFLSGNKDLSYLDNKKSPVDIKTKHLLIHVETLKRKHFNYSQMVSNGINYKRVILDKCMSSGWVSEETFNKKDIEFYKKFLARRKNNKQIRVFVNRDSGEEFKGTTKDFMTYSKIGQRAYNLVTGKIPTAYGWYVREEIDDYID